MTDTRTSLLTVPSRTGDAEAGTAAGDHVCSPITSPITADEILAAIDGTTVASAFLSTVAACPDEQAVRARVEGDTWEALTFAELAAAVARAATGLRHLGVERGDRVVLMMRNRPEFHVVDLATVFLGATPVSVYNSSSPEQIAYVVNDCSAKLAIVEDVGFLDRFAQVSRPMASLRAVITLADGVGGAATYSSLVAAEPADLAAEAAANVRPDDLVTVIYTSGTTGPPKGVMLTHRNMAWMAESLTQWWASMEHFGPMRGFRVLSYLPMAHVMERFFSHYAMAMRGWQVSCCPDLSELPEYLRAVRPEIFAGPPRVWEKLQAGVHAALAADPERRRQFDEAIAAAIPVVERLGTGTATEEDRSTYDFLDAVAFSTVRERLGLDRCIMASTAAAPIAKSLLDWMSAIGLPLVQGYGMSEGTLAVTLCTRADKNGSVGVPIPGAELRVAGDGEVLFRSGGVCAGYLNQPTATADTIDADGWLHSGDIGVLDDDGHLWIVDRKKELIITAGGKNVSPANLEVALKELPLVGQACAVGDGRPFVAALVVLDPELAAAWANGEGIRFDSLADLAGRSEVRELIEGALPAVMARFNNAERVKKLAIVGDEWLPDSDVLTPTMKLKRRGIHERYAADIEALYA